MSDGTVLSESKLDAIIDRLDRILAAGVAEHERTLRHECPTEVGVTANCHRCDGKPKPAPQADGVRRLFPTVLWRHRPPRRAGGDGGQAVTLAPAALQTYYTHWSPLPRVREPGKEG